MCKTKKRFPSYIATGNSNLEQAQGKGGWNIPESKPCLDHSVTWRGALLLTYMTLWSQMQKLASHSECCLKWLKGQCLITVKRHHVHSKSYVGKHLIGADLLFQRVGYSIIVMAGSMAACRRHGCWRSSLRILYWIWRQQEEGTPGPGLSIWNFQAHPPVTYFL